MDLYTTISLTGTVATLLNRDAMLSASVSAGTTVLPIGDSYMDRGTSAIVVFPDGGTLSVGTESLTVVGTPPSATSITVTPSLSNSYPIYTPVLRTDYFDVATDYGTPSTPGTIRVGMEEVSYSTIDVGTNRIRFYIDARGENAYPHTEWAPVTDATFTVNNPATDSEIGRWGVIEAVDYHHGALDQNTLDLHALDKLMDATRPEFGRVEMTGMDVWQDAYYTYKKDITYYVTSPTAFATVRFEVYTTTGTDSASKVYIGDTIQKTWWDIRFVTSGMQNYYLATFGTQSATVWLKIKDPATGGATVSMCFGSPMAIDYTLPATPIGFSVATLGSWSATSTGTFDIGDRGFATVREGDPVNVVELSGASRLYNVSGMIYDQRAGTLTMEIGKPQEYALTDMVKPFRTRDILSTKKL